MTVIQIRCRCNKIISTVDKVSEFDLQRYRKLANKGYIVVESDFLETNERVLEPCAGRPACPLRADWTTNFGFNDLLKEPKNCLTV